MAMDNEFEALMSKCGGMTAIRAVMAASVEAAKERAPDARQSAEAACGPAETAEAGQRAEAAHQPAEIAEAGQSAEAAHQPAETAEAGQRAGAAHQPAKIAEAGQSAEAVHQPAETAEAGQSAEAAHQPDDEDAGEDDIELSGDSSFRPDRDEMDLVSSEDEDDMETESSLGKSAPPCPPIQAILKCLQDTEPTLPSTKLTRPAAKKFPQLMKVLNNHSITSDYHIRFFKKPPLDKCDCMACKNELFKPLIMPEATYNALHGPGPGCSTICSANCACT
eukprot:jgi/Tetstr1/444336/TSEL_032227.t1